MKINSAGIDLIKQFEGCKLESYQDTKGIWTIGFGHTGLIVPGMTITQQEADDFLAKDLRMFAAGVEAMVKVKLTDNQFAALVSFAYNHGLHRLANSTLLKYVNEGHYMNAADQFLVWDIMVPGLVRRREAERKLFLS